MMSWFGLLDVKLRQSIIKSNTPIAGTVYLCEFDWTLILRME